MKNKYLYIVIGIIFLIIFFIISFIWYNSSNHIISSNDMSNTKINIKNSINKTITSRDDYIDPNNYESFGEFLSFFNSGSGINLNVDLLNETFYIKTTVLGNINIVKFDKDLVQYIDGNGKIDLKNQAINDVFNSYKLEKYILGEPNKNRSGVRFLENNELPSSFQLHNNILNPYDGESFLEMLKRFENIKNKTTEEEQELSYLYDYFGEYEKSLKLKKQSKSQKINYRIEGKVFNLGNNLKGAKVEVLNYKGVETITNEKGEYVLEFDTYPLTRLRLRASYEGLSDGYNGTYIILDLNNQYVNNINFSLHNINTKKLIKKSDISGNKKVIVESKLGNSFEFKKGVVIDKNGKIYNGDFYVEIFEFDRNTPGMENFLTLDSFDELYGYTGNMMITTGMTYLLIKDLNGNELFISKKNPIVTKQKVDINFLLSNKEKGTSTLTEGQLNLIMEKSKEGGYPIDQVFFSNRGITGYSPWWILNRTKGIWENRGFKLNKDGLQESLYYNVD